MPVARPRVRRAPPAYVAQAVGAFSRQPPCLWLTSWLVRHGILRDAKLTVLLSHASPSLHTWCSLCGMTSPTLSVGQPLTHSQDSAQLPPFRKQALPEFPGWDRGRGTGNIWSLAQQTSKEGTLGSRMTTTLGLEDAMNSQVLQRAKVEGTG